MGALVGREPEQPRGHEGVAAVADLGDEPRVGGDLEAVLVLERPQLSGGRLEQRVELPVAVGALVRGMIDCSLCRKGIKSQRLEKHSA